jgi:hypothetical protein
MNFADTTTLAEIQFSRADQDAGWDAGDAHDLRARSEREPHLPAEEIVVTTTADRLTDKLVRLTLAAKEAAWTWKAAQSDPDSGYREAELTAAMEHLAATLKEIGA